MNSIWKTSITPHFGDADPLRHINNCRVPVWFEIGRVPIFKLFHPSLALESWPLILARLSVDYIAQMRWDSDVEIVTYIKKIGRTSLTVYQEAIQKGIFSARGETILVHYDYQQQKASPIPAAVAEELQKHMIDPAHPHLRTRSGRFPPLV